MAAVDLVRLLDGPLGDSVARRLLKAIVERKSSQLRELAEIVADAYGPEPDLFKTQQVLNRLKSAQLVDEAPAPIADWNTYFATARGLEIGRALGA